MSKKILVRIAGAILTTGLATTGVVVGGSGPATAAVVGHHHQAPDAVVDPVTGDTAVGDSGGVTVNKFDTGWG